MGEQIKDIPLDQIDDPKIAMRSDAHDDGIDELARSIKEIGLLQPVLLKADGERFEVIAGHRRVTAAKVAGLVTIPAVVRGLSDSDSTTAKLHENLLRRDVNPVDEAIFLAKVMKEQDLSVADVARITKRSPDYISSRMEILEYPDYLINAVGEGEISLGAAHWLNQITEERVRESYVRYAISGGITVKRAIAWYESWKAGQRYSNPQEVKEINPETSEEEVLHKEECMICRGLEVPEGMMLYYAHQECVGKIRQ